MTLRNTALFHIIVRIKRGVFKVFTTTRQFTSRGMIDGIPRTRLARVCETCGWRMVVCTGFFFSLELFVNGGILLQYYTLIQPAF